jgi:hypothetical protein
MAALSCASRRLRPRANLGDSYVPFTQHRRTDTEPSDEFDLKTDDEFETKTYDDFDPRTWEPFESWSYAEIAGFGNEFSFATTGFGGDGSRLLLEFKDVGYLLFEAGNTPRNGQRKFSILVGGEMELLSFVLGLERLTERLREVLQSPG